MDITLLLFYCAGSFQTSTSVADYAEKLIPSGQLFSITDVNAVMSPTNINTSLINMFQQQIDIFDLDLYIKLSGSSFCN